MTTPRRAAVSLVVAASVFAAAAASAHAQDVLVVAPADLQPALAEWKAHRASQGLRVAVREPAADLAAAVKEAHAASGGTLRSVLLLGDVDRVPCAYVPVVATAKWEKDTRIATDAPFADVDGDGVPDLAIGRVPADSVDEARALLARSVAYERDTDFGAWRNRLSIVAGVGGFGPLQDAALETMTKQFLTRQVPPSVTVTGTYGNPLSAWCPPPKEFADTVVERFNEGAHVVAYLGHGAANELDDVRVGRERYPILGAAEVARIDVRRGAPLAVFIACSTGKFDDARDCLAEDVLRRPRGPVAVIASSRVSTPYSNGILSREMLVTLWKEPAATAGELLLAMKRRLVTAPADDAERKQIESLAASFFDPDEGRRAADRREHLALYNLLGDPCLRLARPEELTIDAPGTVVAGTALEVQGTAPAAGTLVVEVVRRRDTVTPIGSRKTADEWRATYLAANALAVARTETKTGPGPFRVRLDLPADARPGPCYVRAFLEGDRVAAAGGRTIDLSAPAAPAPGDGR
jgi:hypothetical protein